MRLDREESPLRVSLFGRALDLKVTGMKLTPGGIYSASFGASKIVFLVDAKAKPGPTPIVGRLIRLD